MALRLICLGACTLALLTGPVRAQSSSEADALVTQHASAEPEPAIQRADDSPSVRIGVGPHSALQLSGYVETYYAYNFNRPRNRVTELRAFDNRHNTFALQAAVLSVGFESPQLSAQITAQLGTAAQTYYAASEPMLPGSAFTPASSAQSWQYLQQAWLAFRPLPALTFDAGLFLSPIGPENLPTHLNHPWSHSLLFFALPFYHAGARVRISSESGHDLRLGIYNGWNNVLDNNAAKTVGLDYTFTPDASFTFGAAYFAGAERATGAPEGNAARHLLDAYITWQPHPRVAILGELDGGLEPNRLGLSRWLAGNASVRVEIHPRWFASGRATLFAEHRAHEDDREAAPIAIPVDRIAAGSVTLETTPFRNASIKLEARYDRASAPLYFSRSDLALEGRPAVPSARDQLTLTLGATAWF